MSLQKINKVIQAAEICEKIHDCVKTSNLDFVIQQTPYSSYITIRKKFQKNAINENTNNIVKVDILQTEDNRDFFPSSIELVATPNPTDLIGQWSGLVWQLTPSTNQISRVYTL